MLDIKIRKIGNAHGVILPREILNKLRVKDGDKLFLTEAADGSYRNALRSGIRKTNDPGQKEHDPLPQYFAGTGQVKQPVWVLKSVVLAVQEELLFEHGGLAGIRDEGLLDSALARPKQLASYGKPDLFILADARAGRNLAKSIILQKGR